MTVPLTGASIIMPGAASSTVQSKTDTFGDLKACVAKALGADESPIYLETAGNGILRAIDVINMDRLFNFTRVQATATDLVDGDGTYALDSDFFKIDSVHILDSDSKVKRKLEFLDWERFNREFQPQTATGGPRYWTSKNTLQDEEIQIYPVPNSDDTDDDIQVTYFVALARPTWDGEQIEAPRQLSTLLCVYGEYFTLDVLVGDKERISRKLAEFEFLFSRFRRQDRRNPDRAGFFSTPSDRNRRPKGPRARTLTIKQS